MHVRSVQTFTYASFMLIVCDTHTHFLVPGIIWPLMAVNKVNSWVCLCACVKEGKTVWCMPPQFSDNTVQARCMAVWLSEKESVLKQHSCMYNINGSVCVCCVCVCVCACLLHVCVRVCMYACVWGRSQMDEEEQMDSITELTNIISAQLGVRERLEAIRIISPNSTVSPTDGEFVLGGVWYSHLLSVFLA